MSIPAIENSTCECGHRIYKGDPVVYDSDLDIYIHDECGEPEQENN
jgi:hypothetical protein